MRGGVGWGGGSLKKGKKGGKSTHRNRTVWKGVVNARSSRAAWIVSIFITAWSCDRCAALYRLFISVGIMGSWETCYLLTRIQEEEFLCLTALFRSFQKHQRSRLRPFDRFRRAYWAKVQTRCQLNAMETLSRFWGVFWKPWWKHVRLSILSTSAGFPNRK